MILSVEALAPPLTGIGRYTWELASRLPAAGQEVRFHRSGRWIDDPATLLQPAPLPAPGPASARARRRLRWPAWLRRNWLAWQCRDQVFHGPNYFLPAWADPDRSVVTVHDLSIFKYPQTHPAARIQQFDREFAVSMRRARHLITDSETTRREVIDFLGWAPERITAVPLGVGAAFRPHGALELAGPLARHGLRPDGYTLCVSTLEPRKMIDRLLDAFEALPAPLRARWPLLLVGSAGWLSEALQARIARLAGQGWLRHAGFVDERDLPALYAGARAFVYPSVYEGFGLPVLEAMASGVPVVTSSRSCLPEVSGGAALLVDPEDIARFGAALEQALDDDSWRAEAVPRGLAVAAAFTWQRCLDRTVEVYAQLA